MSELPLPAAAPIPYAVREDTGLAAAYRLVGWFYIAMAIMSVAGSAAAMVFTMAQGGMRPWSSLAMYSATLAPRLLSIIGAVGMIRTRSWGAFAIAATFAMALLLSVGSGIVQSISLRSSPSWWLIITNIITGSLNNVVMALFPLAMWRICRNKDVLR